MIDLKRRRRHIVLALVVAALTAWGLWVAPLDRPRVVLRDVDAYRVRFSPDGQHLVTAEFFGEKRSRSRVRLWRLSHDAMESTLHEGDEEFNEITFAPDGKQVAGLTEYGLVIIWDTNTAAEVQRSDWRVREGDGDDRVSAPIFYTSTGKLWQFQIDSFYDDPAEFRLKDVATRKEARTMGLADLGTKPVPMWPGGDDLRWFLVLSRQRLVFLDLATGQRHADLTTQFPLEGGEISADGKVVVAFDEAESEACWVANTADGIWSRIPGVYARSVRGLSPDGKYLATHLKLLEDQPAWYMRWLPARDSMIGIVRVGDGTEVARYPGGITTSVAFAPDGRTVALYHRNNEMTVQLWDFPRQRRWPWIIGGPALCAITVYNLLAWRARRMAWGAGPTRRST